MSKNIRENIVPQMTYVTSSANQNTAIKANQLLVIFIKQSNFLIAKITIIKKEFFNTTVINVKHNIHSFVLSENKMKEEAQRVPIIKKQLKKTL